MPDLWPSFFFSSRLASDHSIVNADADDQLAHTHTRPFFFLPHPVSRFLLLSFPPCKFKGRGSLIFVYSTKKKMLMESEEWEERPYASVISAENGKDYCQSKEKKKKNFFFTCQDHSLEKFDRLQDILNPSPFSCGSCSLVQKGAAPATKEQRENGWNDQVREREPNPAEPEEKRKQSLTLPIRCRSVYADFRVFLFH